MEKLPATAVCSSEINETTPLPDGIMFQAPPEVLRNDRRSYQARVDLLRSGRFTRHITKFSNKIALEMHELKQLKEFSIPQEIFKGFFQSKSKCQVTFIV